MAEILCWAVYNHWTGLVDWTGGQDRWTDIFCINTFMLSKQTHLPA